jgi:undecaprenyl-diphosphatase
LAVAGSYSGVRRASTHIGRAAAFARREALALGALLAAVLLAGGFLEIAEEVGEGETQAIDEAVLMALRTGADTHEPIGPQWLEIAAADLTAMGSVAILGFVVLVVAGLFASIRHVRQAMVLLAASTGSVVWSQALKALFSRERPQEAFRALEVVNASFPSGHALLSASVYLTLGALAASFAQRKRIRAFILVSAIAATLLVGATRVYLGVHYPTDVLAGWCLGAAWALICWLALWAWEGRWKPGASEDTAPVSGETGKDGWKEPPP